MRIRLVLILLLAAALVAAWRAESGAGREQQVLLRSLAARLEPFGELRYGPVSAHFWGSGSVRDLRFTPTADLAARLDLPAGFNAHIAELEFKNWQAGSLWPRRAQLRFDALGLPLGSPWPPSYRGSIDWRYLEPGGELHLDWQVDAPGAAQLQGSLALRLKDPQTLAGNTLLAGKLHYRDQGLAQNASATLAVRLGADPQNAQTALAEALISWMTARGLPPDENSRAVLRAFANEPVALTLQLDPPGALRPDTLNLFAPADRIPALGLTLLDQ